MTAPTTAAHFLDGLQECGIEHLFCNLGTDHVSLIEAMAAFERQGRPQPQVLLCPHENVAVHMAGGFAAVTGRGQGVMVHVDAGTANAAMAMSDGNADEANFSMVCLRCVEEGRFCGGVA